MSNINKNLCVKNGESLESNASSNLKSNSNSNEDKKSELSSQFNNDSIKSSEASVRKFPKEIKILGRKSSDKQLENKIPYINSSVKEMIKK